MSSGKEAPTPPPDAKVASDKEMDFPRDTALAPMDIDRLIARLNKDSHKGIIEVADYDPSIIEDFNKPDASSRAPEATPAAPEGTAESPAPATPEAESKDVTDAKERILNGEDTGADRKLVDKFNDDKNQSKDLQAAREASIRGDELSGTQKALLAADIEKRGNKRVANKKAEIDELTAKKNPDGTFTDKSDEVNYDSHMSEKAGVEALIKRADAGETLTDDEIDAMEEGKKVFDLEAESDDGEAVSESEEAKLTRIQGEIDAANEAMLSETDPDKRAEMLTKIAGQQAELMGMQLSASAKERDAQVIKEAFAGKREGKSLLGSNEKRSARNERVQKLIDSMLADAAELQAVAQRMKAIDIARKKILDKVNSEKIRLGHRSTPMDKFIQVREIAPYYRQLLDLDDRMADAKDAEYTFASRFYKNIRSIRAAVKARGVMMRIAESVAFTGLKYTADNAKYTRRVARTLTFQ